MAKQTAGYRDLITHIEDNFEDIEDNVLADLENTNEEYRILLHESSEMDARYPFIWQVLNGEGDVRLTAEEHARLVEYLMTEQVIDGIERRALYFRGHTDAASYTEKVKD